MSASREAFRKQLVKIQPRQSLANSLEQTIMLCKVTSVVKLMEWTIQGATKVKVLSSEIANIIDPSYGLTNEVKLRNTGLFRLH